MIQRFLAAILFAALCVEARANVANFNALTAGATYAEPAIFSDGGLDFDVLFSGVNVAAASGLVNASFTGNYLNLTSGTGLNVNLPTGASQIKFDFIQNNDVAALVINGGWLSNSQIPATINGVTVTHLLGSKTSPWGNIRATGNIDSFFIIGTDYKIDNLDATLVAGLSGDYNKNHAVDAGDYASWRKNLSSPSGFRSWRANFGTTDTGAGAESNLASTSIPEPSTLATLLLGLQCVPAINRRRRS